MIRLIRVEVVKVRTTRLWIGLLLGAVGVVTLGAVATLVVAGSAEGVQAGLTPIETLEDVRDFVYTGSVAGVFALVLGATAMTNEHRHRTLAGTFLATPTRWPVIFAKVIGSGAADSSSASSAASSRSCPSPCGSRPAATRRRWGPRWRWPWARSA